MCSRGIQFLLIFLYFCSSVKSDYQPSQYQQSQYQQSQYQQSQYQPPKYEQSQYQQRPEGPQIIKIGAIFFSDEGHYRDAFDQAIKSNNNQLEDFQIEAKDRFISPDDDSLKIQRIACELIDDGVVAIFGPSSRISTDIVAVICNETGIPHIMYDYEREETVREKELHSMTIHVAPAISILSKAYFDIVSSYGWKSFTIVYDNDNALVRLQDILQLRAVGKLSIRLIKFNADDDYRIFWKAIQNSGERRVILDCDYTILKVVLNTSVEYDIMDQFNYLLLTNLNTHRGFIAEINNQKFKSNITSVRVAYSFDTEIALEVSLIYDSVQLLVLAIQGLRSTQNIRFETNMKCGGASSIYNPKWEFGETIMNAMKTIGNSNQTFITKNIHLNNYNERIGFELEIYKPLTDVTLAIWNTDGKITPTDKQAASSKTKKKPDFAEGTKHFRVAIRIVGPYFMRREGKNGEVPEGNNRYEGYCVDLIRKLSKISKFEFTFVEVDSNGKYVQEKREWDGIIGHIIDRKADIGISDLTITQQRREVVDFTVPFMSLGISILNFKAEQKKQELFAFLKPFSLEVWLYMSTFLLIISLLNVLLARLSRNEWENPHPCNPNPEELENKWHLINTTWLVLGSIMGQGCDILPRTAPMRLVSGMWWFFALMMLNSYTANLAAFMTSNRQNTGIKSINDLADQNKIQFGTQKGGSTEAFFKESNDSVYRLAWSKMIQTQPTVFTDTPEAGVERVKKSKGDYAFLMETTSLEYQVEQNCDLENVGSQIGEKHYGIAVPIGSDYRSNLSWAILQLGEKGELFELKKKWWTKKDPCVKTSVEDGSDLSVKELSGVFLVLLGGLIIAYILGVGEFLWNIQKIAVEEKITPYEAIKREALFAVQFWKSKKPIFINDSNEGSSSSSEKSS